jgi:hypothetical protein
MNFSQCSLGNICTESNICLPGRDLAKFLGQVHLCRAMPAAEWIPVVFLVRIFARQSHSRCVETGSWKLEKTATQAKASTRRAAIPTLASSSVMPCAIPAARRVALGNVNSRQRRRSVDHPKIRTATWRRCVLVIRPPAQQMYSRQTGRAVGPTAWRVRRGSVPP